jgi:tetratricopeptide (TPR) repeat protein
VSSEQAKLLRQQGIAAAKAGQRDQARDLLRQSLRLEPQNEAAWTWLVTVAKDNRERVVYLQKLLEINPYNEIGVKALQGMGITRDQLRALTSQATPTPVAKVTVQPNVPLPHPQRVADAQEAAEEVVQRFLTPPSAGEITWVSKKRRAGERDAIVFRLQVIAGVVGALVVLVGLGVLLALATPEGRATLLLATATSSPTPTVTPSPTFGATPTASITPELTSTPSPTPPPQLTPADPYRFPPTPTDIYPQILAGRAIRDAALAIQAGSPEAVIPTLDAARISLVGPVFDPAPTYYQALALVDAGRPDDALTILQEAETELAELEPSDQRQYSVLINTGYAYLYLRLGEQALERNRGGEAADYFGFVEERANAAREVDPVFVQPYLLLARAYILQEEYTQASLILNDGLNVPELASDTNLILAVGDVYLAQGDYNAAAYQAYLALYVDPTLQVAHRLQIQSALRSGDAGLAVIYAQQYIFYYPGSVEAYKLLGDARMAEGNTDLALAAYSQALEGERSDSAFIETLVARAALYSSQRRFELALNDLTTAVDLSDSAPRILALRMYAAYYAGRYGTAQEDADDLIGSGIIPDEEIKLMQARILVDTAEDGDETQLNAAFNLLREAGDVPNQPGVAAEYRARVEYRLGAFENALTSITTALDAGESGSRYFLLAQILEELDEYAAAARAYEWVVTWSNIYPYPFLPEAQEGLQRTLEAAEREEETTND